MDVAEYLSEHGVKPSYQRVRVLSYMLEKKNHPTVDMIFGELSKDIPTLSRTTVYNTVNLFHQKGLVQKLGIDDEEARYDADITVHAHFRCDKCGNIFDLPVQEPAVITGLEKMKVREIQYFIKGLCDKCK